MDGTKQTTIATNSNKYLDQATQETTLPSVLLLILSDSYITSVMGFSSLPYNGLK
jgi:hypothetical protein